MTIYPSPTTVLLPSLLVGLVAAGIGAKGRLGGDRPGLRVLYAAAAGWLLLAGLTWTWFDTSERRVPILIGLSVGALLGLVWDWLLASDERDPSDLGPLGGGLIGLAVLGFALEPGVPLANGVLGLMAAWAVPQLVALLERPAGSGLALGMTALAGGAAAWGSRLTLHGAQQATGLWALPVALAAMAVLGQLVALLLGSRRAGWAGGLVAAVVFLLGGLALGVGPYQVTHETLYGIGAGALGGLIGALWLPAEGKPRPVAGLVYLLVMGGLLVLENRLQGILAIGLAGLGLVAGSGGLRGPRPLVAAALGVFAARVWMQLFLDRTTLVGYGVDLTHPYAFAALIVGGLLPAAAVAVGREVRPLASLSVGWALVLALIPAWLGYLIHVEALGGLVAGLMLGTFVVAAQDDEEAVRLLPALLLGVMAVTMLAAPWLVDHLNAPRADRVWGFLDAFALVVLAFLRWWVYRRAEPAA